jgi:YidC/Oxa1 family membrane protein insertase
VHIVTIILIVVMMATSYFTTLQLMASNKASGLESAPGADGTQKFLLYGMPIFFGILGYNFQLGVLLYWVTTNFWTYGQQAFVLKRMNAELQSGAGTAAAEVPADPDAGPQGDPQPGPQGEAEPGPQGDPEPGPHAGPVQAG